MAVRAVGRTKDVQENVFDKHTDLLGSLVGLVGSLGSIRAN